MSVAKGLLRQAIVVIAAIKNVGTMACSGGPEYLGEPRHWLCQRAA